MNYRPYRKSGKMVSEIGFGAWQLGNDKDWNGPKYEVSIKLVQKAVELGCNFFDTAPNYGEGRSELILGEALKDFNREKIVINTKVGHMPGVENGFDPGVIQQTIENSLKKLQTDYLDSVILHNPPLELLDQKSSQFKVLEKMRSEGIIKAYGASLDYSHEVNKLVENTDSEVVEILFNIFFQNVRKVFTSLMKRNMLLLLKYH